MATATKKKEEKATVSGGYPAYNEPSKGSAVRSNHHHNSHELVDKGDPKVNGPYLDDVRAVQEEQYRANRQESLKGKKVKNVEKKFSRKSKEEVNLQQARQDTLEEQDRERVVSHRPLQPGDVVRPETDTLMETKTHPRERPLSNPSDVDHPEDNLPVPKLEDVKVDLKRTVANSVSMKSHPKPKKKSAKKSTAKKATAKKATKKTAAKKSTPKKKAAKKS